MDKIIAMLLVLFTIVCFGSILFLDSSDKEGQVVRGVMGLIAMFFAMCFSDSSTKRKERK